MLNAAERLGKMKTRHRPLKLMTLVTLGELLHGFVRETGVGLRGMKERWQTASTRRPLKVPGCEEKKRALSRIPRVEEMIYGEAGLGRLVAPAGREVSAGKGSPAGGEKAGRGVQTESRDHFLLWRQQLGPRRIRQLTFENCFGRKVEVP